MIFKMYPFLMVSSILIGEKYLKCNFSIPLKMKTKSYLLIKIILQICYHFTKEK